MTVDIITLLFIATAVAVGVVSLVVESFRHVPLGKALILAMGNGFITFVIVAFGSALVVVVKTAIENGEAKKKGQTKEI